jgi:AmmeMemoRadiSam system protein B
MEIASFSQHQIKQTLNSLPEFDREMGVKALFVPVSINSTNLEQTSYLYKAIQKLPFETFVIVETYDKAEMSRKLPMPSADYFVTPFGSVPANDALRNDFADEEDDFFIDDSCFNPEMSLYQQLMMLQCTRSKFDVVSIQIADSRPSIIKELAWVISEILSIKNAMTIFCCDLPDNAKHEFSEIKRYIAQDDMSGLMNFINSGSAHMRGGGAFQAGVMVAKAWEMQVQFLSEDQARFGGNLLAGFASFAQHD